MSSETHSADEKVISPRDHSSEPATSNRDSPTLESQKESQPAAPPPPPDGGINAWLQAFGNFFLFFNSWGTINSYGVFQTYYATSMFPSQSESAISWVGSIQTFLLLALGGVVGRWVDAGYFKTCITFGSFMMVFGMMMTSLAKEFWQVVLAQGIVAGLGSGFLFLPGVAVVSTYFSSKRAFALGVGAAGSSIGGVLFPIIIRNLIPTIGFGWAVRVMAFIMLGTLTIPCLVMRQRIPPRKMGPLIDLPSFKEPAYNFFTWGKLSRD
jgi:MFS family permease